SAINSVAVGYLANLAVPRLGEVTRCTAMHKAEDVPVDTLLGTVLAERVIDLLMLGLCFLLVLVLKFDDFMVLANQGGDSLESSGGHMGPWALGAAAVLGAALVLAYTTRSKWIDLPISRKVIAFLKGVGTGLLSVARVKKPVLFIAYTLLIWLMYFLMSYLYFFCLPETVHLHFADGLFVMMAGSLGIIAPSPGGIGAFHATVIAALVVLGIDKVSAGSLAIIVHSSQTLMTLLTGILALILLSLAGKKTKDGVLSKKV
ncbi:MAG TPA: lysylphosphatidylglycerol synthase transmembrane domain-containing protein, partial [Luteibaculaceae bacterium]|nr:lysylphosphatidylglycerol synthase transmembrane domain-containing protein [Luteibaculaceae bacterium]